MQVADEHIGDLAEAQARLREAAARAVSAVDQIGFSSGDHYRGCLLTSDADTGTALSTKQQQRRLVGQRIGARAACSRGRLLEGGKRSVAHPAKDAGSRE